MWRVVHADGPTATGAALVRVRGGGPLAVGPGDVEGAERLLRMPGPGKADRIRDSPGGRFPGRRVRFLRSSIPGPRQVSQDRRQRRLEPAAFHDQFHHPVLEEKLGALEPLRNFLKDRLLRSPAAPRTRPAPRLGEMKSSSSIAKLAATPPVVGSVSTLMTPRASERRAERRARLGHLHHREGPLLHARPPGSAEEIGERDSRATSAVMAIFSPTTLPIEPPWNSNRGPPGPLDPL